VLGSDHVAQVAHVLHAQHDEGQEREPGGGHAAEEVDAEHRAEPRRRERHHPVEGGEDDRESVQQDQRRRPLAHPLRECHAARRILRARGAQEPRCCAAPDEEVGHRADHEEVRVEVGGLLVDDRGLGRVVRAHPLHVSPRPHETEAGGPVVAEVGLAEVEPRHRQEEDPDPGEVGGDRLGDAAHHHAPSRAHQVLDQRELQAAEAKREHEHEVDEVDLGELRGVGAVPADPRGREKSRDADAERGARHCSEPRVAHHAAVGEVCCGCRMGHG